MAWYLAPLNDLIASFIVCNSKINLQEIDTLPLPDGLDPECIKRLHTISSKIQLINSIDDVIRRIKNNDVVLTAGLSLRDQIKKQVNGHSNVFNICHLQNRFADSFYLKIAQDVFKYKPKAFGWNMLRALRKSNYKKAYIFGTAPLLEAVESRNFGDGVSIACNSMVKNHQFMKVLNPHIFVSADPIFHAGPSVYAADYRKLYLKMIKERTSLIIIYPLRDAHIYESFLDHDIMQRAIAIDWKQGSDIRYNFDSEKSVSTTSNILTLFLLPLAAYLSNEIWISGCDGRPDKNNSYFWSHSAKSQLTNRMNDIQKVHPAFFDISYDDYYNTHKTTLSTYINQLSIKGYSIFSMTPSYIACLRNLFATYLQSLQSSPLISVIIPIHRPGEMLRKCLSSLQKSSYPNLEILCVESDIDQLSKTILNEFIEMDPRIKTIKCDRHGVSAARNIGLTNSTGHYISFLDSDDWISQDSLEKRIDLLEATKCNIVHSDCILTDELCRPTSLKVSHTSKLELGDLLSGNKCHLNSLTLRKSAFLESKVSFIEEIENGEDWLFLAECIKKLGPSRYVDSVSFYRINRNSAVSQDPYAHEKSIVEKVFPRLNSLLCDGIKEKPNDFDLKSNDFAAKRYITAFWSALFCGSENVDEVAFTALSFLDKSALDLKVIKSLVRVPSLRAYGYINIAEISKHLSFSDLNNLKSIHFLLYSRLHNYSNSLLAAAVNDFIISVTHEFLDSQPYIDAYPRRIGAHIDETNVIYNLFENIKGDTMIDVGVHYGGSSLQFLKKGWTIHGFEPDNKNRSIFNDRLEKCTNDEKSRFLLRTVGCSDKVIDNVPFFSSDVSSGISGLSSFHDTHIESQLISITTLKLHLQVNPLQHISFLKIDTEGHDLFVLKGFPWEKFRPKIIECEYEDKKTIPLGYSLPDMCEYLSDKNYVVFVSEWHPIVEYGRRHQWCTLHRYPELAIEPSGWGNLIAIRKDLNLTKQHLIESILKNVRFYPLESESASTESKADCSDHNKVMKTNKLIDSPITIAELGSRMRKAITKGDLSVAIENAEMIYSHTKLMSYKMQSEAWKKKLTSINKST